MRFGFCAGTYTSQSINADCQRCMNWYPETIESNMGKTAVALYPTPGLSLLATIGNPVRGCIGINGELFFVGGSDLWKVTLGGVTTNLGSVGNDGNPVSMATNGTAGNQVAVVSAGNLYVFNTSTNTFSGPITGIQGTPVQIVFCDGYGVVTLANSNKFQVSALEDMTTWNALSVQQVEVFPENIGGIIQAFRQLWIFGLDGHSQVYYNSGANPYTPFDVISGAYMEEGLHATWSLAVADNAPFWLGGYVTGGPIAWRANGYTPQRISNFAVETAWATYPNQGSDAVGYAYVDQGHTFYVLRFPSANNGHGATWVYDVATQQWHERGYWSEATGTYWAHLSSCHLFSGGQHLVGDWNSGNIYTMAITNYTDAGASIRRLRRAPHISTEQVRIFHNFMQIDVEVGDGPMPPLYDGAGNPRGPEIILRWSDDGGRTWSNEYPTSAGQAGEYRKRVFWNRLGQARDRVYEITATDPIPWRIADAYLRATPGFNYPVPRLPKQWAGMS